MKQIIILLLLSSFQFGCYTKKQAIQRFCTGSSMVKDSTAIRDSVRLVNRFTDSVVIIPKSVLEIDLDNLCDSLGRVRNVNIRHENGAGSLSIYTEGNHLKVKLNIDSIIAARYKKQNDSLIKLTTNIATHLDEQVITIPPPAWYKTVPWWKWLIDCFLSGFFLWIVALKIRPLFFRIPI